MDEPLRDQICYLEARLSRLRRRPALHVQQLSAYQNQLRLARNASTGLEYLRAMTRTRSTLEVVRAEWIDRYRNWGRIYDALGEDDHRLAAAVNVRAAEQSGSGVELMTALFTAKGTSTGMTHIADACMGLVSSLLTGLLDWRVAVSPPTLKERARVVKSLWTTLRANDPVCTWRRLGEYPPYRQRIPFDDPTMTRLGGWLRAVVGPEACDTPANAERPQFVAPHSAAAPASGGEPDWQAATLPSAAQAAHAYHITYDALDHSDPENRGLTATYKRIFELEASAAHGPEFLRLMAESGMYCELARAPQLAFVRGGLARCVGRGQAHAEYHYRELERALLACATPTEVEYEVERATRMFAVEVAWNDILISYAARPIAAAAVYAAERDDAHRHLVRACHRATRDVLGRDWQQILDSPRVWQLFSELWFVEGSIVAAGGDPRLGARFGELGAATILRIREAAMQRIIERTTALGSGPPDADERQRQRDDIRSGRQFDSPEDLRAYLERGLNEALADAPSNPLPAPVPSQLLLWNQPLDMDTWHQRLLRPGRPTVVLD